MLINPETGRKMIPAGEAAKLFGCTTSHIARLARDGEIRRVLVGSHQHFYDLEDVSLLALKNSRIRSQRGGRPPGPAAA